MKKYVQRNVSLQSSNCRMNEELIFKITIKQNLMPSVRLELTTFRLWDWRSNQLSQEGYDSLWII